MSIKSSFFLLVVFLSGCGSLFGQTASDISESQKWLQESQSHLENKEYRLFKESVQQAVNLRPNHPSLILNYAYAYCLTEEYGKALKKLAEIAQMGVYIDLDRIEEFAKLSSINGYKKVVESFKNNLSLVGQASLEFELTNRDLLVEGIYYNTQENSFYLTSVHQQKVLKYNIESGDLTETTVELSPLSIKPDRTGDFLWISLAGIKEGSTTGKNDLGKSGLAKFDLPNNELLEYYYFPEDSADHSFGDILPDKGNIIYISDSKSAVIYQFDKESKEYSALTEDGQFISPQGMLFSSNGNSLIVSDYSIGLVMVNMKTGSTMTLDNQTNTTLLGIDGIYRWTDSIIAIQNGVRPNRVIKLIMNSDETAVIDYEILLANHPAVDDPTLGVVLDPTFYFNANSQWGKFSQDYNEEKMGQRNNPKILSIKLK